MRRSSANNSPRPAPSPAPTRGSRFGLRQLFLLGLAIVGVVGIYWRLSSPDAERQQALKAAASGDFATAEPLLRRARDARPDDLELIKALAIGYAQADRVDEAEAEFTRWSELRPEDVTPVAAHFHMCVRVRQNDRAVPVAEHLLRFQTIDPELYPPIVAVYMIAGRVRDAMEAVRAGLAVKPGDVRLRLQLAEVLHVQGQSKDALDVLQLLTRDAPDLPDGWRLRGLVTAELDDPAAAIAFLERALTLKPADLAARYGLGLALRRCGRESDARRELDRFEKARVALDLANSSWNDPERLDLGIRAAAAMFEAGLDLDGHKFVRQVLVRDPNNAEALRLREAHRATLPR